MTDDTTSPGGGQLRESRPPEAAEAMTMARAVADEAASMLAAAGPVGAAASTKRSVRDLVTEWDQRSEDLIRERLTALTPDIPILGEEGGYANGDGDGDGDAGERTGPGSHYRWLVDPIDGTVNFSHGLPLFAVSIALEKDGQSIAGAVYAPALSWQFYGCAGGGAFMNGERLAVSGIDSLERALLITGFPHDRASNPDNNFAEWEHMQRVAGDCRRLGSAALDLCMIARGWAEGYWERHLSPWDIAAGELLVREAGGMVTAIDGGPFSADSGQLIASNGAIHAMIASELLAVRTGRGDTSSRVP
ncbi:MAG: inositol monophosphatase family protein [Myxococcota bacterium]